MFFLYLIRHGQSECNIQRVFPGRDSKTDLPLTEAGIFQAEVTAEILHSIIKNDQQGYVLYHSPAKRTTQTAEIISKRIKVKSCLKEGLWFRNQGVVAGLKHDEAKAKYPKHNFVYPKAETRMSEYDRVVKSWREVESRASNKNIIIIAHDTTISHICHYILDIPFDGVLRFYPIENCSVSRLQFGRSGYDGKACLNYFNNTRHLQLLEQSQ